MKHIDGYLYAGISIFGSLTASFSTDEAVKFIAPEWLFYGKTVFAAITAGLLAAKMYRSTTFANLQNNLITNGNGNGETQTPKPLTGETQLKPPGT